ncbi:MAG: fructosamine kinase family protein [Bacteroidota bacterium]|nr:fructosamine kinase family protein [Bacteroidota bacterium]
MAYPSSFIKTVLKEKLSAHFSAVNNLQLLKIGGGSINETYRITFSETSVFCKINSATQFPQMFNKERKGLELIGKQHCIKVPAVVEIFECEDTQILLLEWIIEGEKTEAFWKKFGGQLASLHQASSNFFGLSEDNYMGSVPQQNSLQKNWRTFFITQRLQPMIRRCEANNLITNHHQQQFENLFLLLPTFFDQTQQPSLLHGDLWSGNFMCNRAGEPILIDPAVYYGNRCMDLAMTTLFGGFHKSFYNAYNYYYPLPGNYEEQCQICNLYPLLIHLYLFGRSYLPKIEQTLKRFL